MSRLHVAAMPFPTVQGTQAAVRMMLEYTIIYRQLVLVTLDMNAALKARIQAQIEDS